MNAYPKIIASFESSICTVLTRRTHGESMNRAPEWGAALGADRMSADFPPGKSDAPILYDNYLTSTRHGWLAEGLCTALRTAGVDCWLVVKRHCPDGFLPAERDG